MGISRLEIWWRVVKGSDGITMMSERDVLCSNDDTPRVFPGSSSFCVWHRPPPRLIGFIFFGIFGFRVWGCSGIFWWCAQTRCCLMRDRRMWKLIGCWSMWRERWKHWWRVNGNGHPWSGSCCGMRIEKWSRRWLSRGMMGRSGRRRRTRTWTRAV